MVSDGVVNKEFDQIHDGVDDPLNSRWIEDEGLLRDEGAILGLSGVDSVPESKIGAIEAYFNARVERVEAVRRLLLDERASLQSRASEQFDLLREMQRELGATVEIRSPYGHPTSSESFTHGPLTSVELQKNGLEADAAIDDAAGGVPTSKVTGGSMRYLFGWLLALGMCILTYFVVREVIGSRFDHPENLALGIMAVGMFIVFTPISLLFSSDELLGSPPWGTELWKVRLAEFGPPITAACFAVVWGEYRDLLHSLTAFFFLSMTFLFGGRLLLSLTTRLGIELGRQRERLKRKERKKIMQKELQRLHADHNMLTEEILRINILLRALRTPEDLRAECQYKISLLQSEFELARSAADVRDYGQQVHY